MWYELEVPLEDVMIYGPFRFEARYHVPEEAWESLRRYGQRHPSVYTDNLDRIIGLGQPDEQYRDKNNEPVAFLARMYRMPDDFYCE
jgi:hypothetical protein